MLDDGRVLDVANIIWCTGFSNGFSWIDLPIFGADGEPEYDRGIVSKVPGLYFVGLNFLYAMTWIRCPELTTQRGGRHVTRRASEKLRGRPVYAEAGSVVHG